MMGFNTHIIGQMLGQHKIKLIGVLLGKMTQILAMIIDFIGQEMLNVI